MVQEHTLLDLSGHTRWLLPYLATNKMIKVDLDAIWLWNLIGYILCVSVHKVVSVHKYTGYRVLTSTCHCSRQTSGYGMWG